MFSCTWTCFYTPVGTYDDDDDDDSEKKNRKSSCSLNFPTFWIFWDYFVK